MDEYSLMLLVVIAGSLAVCYLGLMSLINYARYRATVRLMNRMLAALDDVLKQQEKNK